MKDRWADQRQAGKDSPGWTWPKMAAIVVAGVLVGLLSMAVTSAVYKNTLRTRINSIAQALGSQGIDSLKDNTKASSATTKADYAFLEAKLARIKNVNSDARFVYLMDRRANGEVYFLTDSEPDGSSANSPRGEAYPEASTALRSMFDDGRTVIEGPLRDSYGSWLSALAPVTDDQTYRLTAVVGIDIPSTTYGWLLALAGGIPLLLAILAAAILYVRHQIRRRQREHFQFRAEMLSIASHELRTPLTGLRWSQESLLNHKLAPKAERHALEIMYDSTLRLQESIEDILQLANLESGKPQRLFIKPADVREIINGIIAMERLTAERKRVAIIFSDKWPEKLPLECDIQRIKRVFSNLIGNAIKYSNSDTQIMIDYRQADGQHIISIQDHGIGVPAAEQSKVWDGFYRASNTTAHDVTGTGMGLFLTRSIVEQHGGHVWLESEENKGTTVYVALPITEPKAEQVAPPATQTKG
jgi:signal transduction histidine kinase